MDEPLTELAAYFRRDTRLPDQELVRLTAWPRADARRERPAGIRMSSGCHAQ